MRRNPYKIGRSEGRFASFLKRSGIKLTLKGREGRFLRTVLIALGAIILLIALFKFLKPETQLMSSVEIRRIESRGTLNVGVRGDMPGFCEGGEGLEAELAKLLAKRILPDSADPCRLNVCSPKSVSAKLSDGTVDIAIALLPHHPERRTRSEDSFCRFDRCRKDDYHQSYQPILRHCRRKDTL